jgi:hypothetical protein
MGLFWDPMQQSRIFENSDRTDALANRIARLEDDLPDLQKLARELIGRLEKHVGQDLNSDGRIG